MPRSVIERQLISIHALREEGDNSTRRYSRLIIAFLSTPSVRRATFAVFGIDMARIVFLSTPSVRRATREMLKRFTEFSISIHALREEGDEHRHERSTIKQHFYPRPP